MAQTFQLAATVIADVMAVLNAASATNVFRANRWQDVSNTLPGISVGVQTIGADIIHEDGGPTGYWRVDVLVDGITLVSDDAEGTVLDGLVEQITTALCIDDLVSQLNVRTLRNWYKAAAWGETGETSIDGARHSGVTLTLRLASLGDSETSTTTTTTTSTTT